MNSLDFDRYIRRTLDLDAFQSADSSLNGLQVDNSGAPLSKVAFAVDACLETFDRAHACGAQLLFVHHGLFWGRPQAIQGPIRERLARLFSHDLALYAVHLPLDQHPVLGNNAGLASLLKMTELHAFGLYHGKKIGYKGIFNEPISTEEAAQRIGIKGRPPLAIWPFGPSKNKTCGVISGGAAMDLSQAIDEHLDLYITGEVTHEIYHLAREARINVVCGGHYATEVHGVRSVMAAVAADTGLETEFIDAPTSL